ncbi:MAG: glycoside hydrolase family 3 protein [Gemmatimonadota bacterium]
MKIALIPTVLALAAGEACSTASIRTPDERSPSPSAQRPTSGWVDSVMSTLSPRDRAAQLVWPWVLGDYVPVGSAEWGRISRLVTEERVGGVIISVGGPVDIAEKLNALQRLSVVPLLVSADLETGVGFRARGGWFVPNAIDLGGATNFPLQMALGAAGDTTLAYEMGRITAVEGRALGIHIAYGPVLDVNNNPANPVIGARSISESPVWTARMGAAVVRGLQENGMLATGKHFPGHGDTETNSHLALATVTATRARLDSVELFPFREAIKAGVGAMMTFHGFLPALDSAEIPATLSPRVMTRLLREELGFQGLLVTDAMDMRGVVDKFGPAEMIKRAVAAGNDLLLMPADIRGAIAAVVEGVNEGRYTQARVDSSVRRILELKERFSLNRQRLVPIEKVRQVVGDSAHGRIAQQIAERSFTLVRDRDSLVPLRSNGRGGGVGGGGGRPRVLSVTYARRAELSAGGAFNAELQRGLGSIRTQFVSADDAEPGTSALLAAAGQSDVVIINSYVNITSETATADAPRAFLNLVGELLRRGSRVVIVSFGTPYLLAQMPGVSSYAVAWGNNPFSQRAAARAILGEIPITGTLPITIPGIASLGSGEKRAALRE